MKIKNEVIIYSIIAGLIITLLSGLMPTITFEDVLGVSYHGSPWPWLSIKEDATSIICPNLFFNTIIWSVVIFSGYYLFKIAKK